MIEKNKLFKQIIETKENELRKHKKIMEMQSKEIFDVDHTMPIPNTAKSYIDNRKASYHSK
jgi:hypothetical protein